MTQRKIAAAVFASLLVLGSGADASSASSGSAKGVRVYDASKRPICELDEVGPGAIFEDKTAASANFDKQVKHDLRLKGSSAKEKLKSAYAAWAQNQIAGAAKTKIDAIRGARAKTTGLEKGKGAYPTLEQLRHLHVFHFRIQSDFAALKPFVDKELDHLRLQFKNWKFEVTYGHR